MSEEGLAQTENDKIFIGKQIQLDETSFVTKLEELKEIAQKNESDEAVKCLHEIVPTFKRVKN